MVGTSFQAQGKKRTTQKLFWMCKYGNQNLNKAHTVAVWLDFCFPNLLDVPRATIDQDLNIADHIGSCPQQH